MNCTEGRIAPEIDWVADIGMFAINRSIPVSCVWATDFCEETCYNKKIYRRFPNSIPEKDRHLEIAWASCSGGDYTAALDRKRVRQTDRVRLMSRGEALKELPDVDRVADIASSNLARDFWLPTRAWRDPMLRIRIETELHPMPNLVVLASLDPTTVDDWEDLRSAGWSTMFYGEDDRTHTPSGAPLFRCPKTFRGIKGHCASCKAGCFAELALGRQADVHLQSH